jgi:Protein of unknown function (DUF3606)
MRSVLWVTARRVDNKAASNNCATRLRRSATAPTAWRVYGGLSKNACSAPNTKIGSRLEQEMRRGRSRISLLKPHEVQYWADKFGVSKERLSEAAHKQA